jgi:hypothetical protein
MELLIIKDALEDDVLLQINCKLVRPLSYLAGQCIFLGRDSEDEDFKFKLLVNAEAACPDGNTESSLNFEVVVPADVLSNDSDFYHFAVVDQDSIEIDSLRIGGGSILTQAEPDETEKPIHANPSSPFAFRP